MRNIISPEEGAELTRLYAELPAARSRVLAAIQAYTDGTDGLARWKEADDAEAAIMGRGKEILAGAHERWNGQGISVGPGLYCR